MNELCLMGASPRSLRKEILNYDETLTAYDGMSTDADIPHIHFLLCLASWASDINKELRVYLEKLDKGECDEVLGIDFKKMTRKEYWLKSGRLKRKMQDMKDIALKDFGLVYKLNGQEFKNVSDIYQKIEEGICEMVALLKEAKRKTLNAPIELFGKFYHKLANLLDEEPIITGYEEWRMSIGKLTFERLKEYQTKVVADFLCKGLFRPIFPPSNRELNQVKMEKVRDYLPSKYEFSADFEEQCALFRRFISWEDDVLKIDYDTYGKYLFRYFYQFTYEELVAFFALDKTLQLIHQDMAEIKPNETSLLPEVLATPEAMLLWKKVQQAGYVDEHYQPLISRTQAALLADAMAEKLGIREKWKVFEQLWNRKNIRSDYNDALSQRKALDFQDELKKIFAE